MMKKILLILCLCFAGCESHFYREIEDPSGGKIKLHRDSVHKYKQGIRAYELGISAEANPYDDDGHGSVWLMGWMDAKEADIK